jgi:hypothetical protein
MRKLFFLLTLLAGILTAQAQTFTNGLTNSGTVGAGAIVKLGGQLTAATPVDLTTFPLLFKSTAQANLFNILPSGNIGLGLATPTALFHLKGGTATAGTAPLKFTSGTILATPEAGVLEFDGSHLYFTPTVGARKIIALAEVVAGLPILPISKGGTGASVLATGYIKSNGTVLSSSTTVTGADVSGNIPGNAVNVTGIIGAPNGGTGNSTYAIGDILYASAANTLTKRIIGSAGQVLTVSAGLPVWAAPSLTGITGTLPIANGGTGAATAATALTALLPLQTGNATKVLRTDGTVATWQTVAGTGTVTTASVATANGFAGTVATAATTPVITLTTPLTGILRGNGTAMVAATAGVDYALPNANTTGSAASFSGNLLGDVTGTQAATIVGKINNVSMAGLATGILKNTTGTGTPSIAVAADFPTLNQNTTGNAATATLATTATNATNLTGGQAGAIPYQTGAGTGMSTVGTSGYVLTSGGAGQPTWTAPAGLLSSAWNIGGNTGTNPPANFIGTKDANGLGLMFKTNDIQSGFIEAVRGNTSWGLSALLNTSGFANTGIGNGALLNNTGNWNTATGAGAMGINTGGGGLRNTANGYLALFSNVGIENTAIGANSSKDNTTGAGNTATGAYSLQYNTTGNGNTVYGFGALQFHSTGSYNTVIGYYNNGAAPLFANGNNNTVLGSRVSGLSSTLTNNIIIADGSGNRRINVNAAGNVGIGTNDATQKLEVKDGNILTNQNIYASSATSKVLIGNMFDAGNVPLNIGTHNLVVNGSALFTKAVVRLTNTWPDFVFEPTYNLPSLKEIEKYINKNKHLPDVPSAAEVKEKGIDLGDNQAILLKKVEELTLYMIELNKKVEQLAKENEDLKKKVNDKK